MSSSSELKRWTSFPRPGRATTFFAFFLVVLAVFFGAFLGAFLAAFLVAFLVTFLATFLFTFFVGLLRNPTGPPSR